MNTENTTPLPAGDAFSFASLDLAPALRAALEQLAYTTMTPVQAATLPVALDGHDVIAQAKTGSGKTAAFGLPILAALEVKRFAVQAMVVCPTRELADQVAQEIRRLARFMENVKVLTLTGGTPMRGQMESLAHGAHIVVGTPGRLIDHLQRESLPLSALRMLVLDEADRMLDMGFHDDISYIARHCPASRQTLLFSATYPDGIAQLAARFLRRPRDIRLADKHAPQQIRQQFFETSNETRLADAARLLADRRPNRALAFCNTRAQCNTFAQGLRELGFSALALTGELEQHERDQVLIQFAHESCAVLVATDVAARGLDITSLELVLNVDVTPDPEVHVHRVGRTGRADEDGWALSLSSPAEKRRVEDIARFAGFEPEWLPLPEVPTPITPIEAPMCTLLILGGRKAKIRPADILGALTGSAGFARDQVGKITVTEEESYVAVPRAIARDAVQRLAAGTIKGRRVKVRALRS